LIETFLHDFGGLLNLDTKHSVSAKLYTKYLAIFLWETRNSPNSYLSESREADVRLVLHAVLLDDVECEGGGLRPEVLTGGDGGVDETFLGVVAADVRQHQAVELFKKKEILHG
jgi:hypothetical protein